MEKLLFVNACVREESRTYRLARRVMEKWRGDIETVDLSAEPVAALDGALLKKREALREMGELSGDMFRHARQLQAADVVLIAAPYWDLSFPACLKAYFEAVNIGGITFTYTPEGAPTGLCRARRLIYVSTSGGALEPLEFGYGYVRALATKFWGIEKTDFFGAGFLDVKGADAGAGMEKALRVIDIALDKGI